MSRKRKAARRAIKAQRRAARHALELYNKELKLDETFEETLIHLVRGLHHLSDWDAQNWQTITDQALWDWHDDRAAVHQAEPALPHL